MKVPVAGLTSKRYAAELRKAIDPERARPAQSIRAGNPAAHEGDNTTHYSVVDADGNAVANTYTLNFSYGLGLVADGTGILLNNELDDFAAKAGAPNAYGLVGGDANAPGPGKRPLSSMSPTIVMRDGRVLLVTGTPGGSRIITTVLQVVLNVIDHGMNIAEAVAAPRIHHQWLPDQVFAERGLSPDTLRLLEAKGHRIVDTATIGSANSILVTPGGLTGARRSAPARHAGGRILVTDIVRELERAKGFEPSTPTLARSCSTPELHPHPRRPANGLPPGAPPMPKGVPECNGRPGKEPGAGPPVEPCGWIAMSRSILAANCRSANPIRDNYSKFYT